MENKFKLMYNQDCSNVFILTGEPFQISHVHAMVDEVADAGVDIMLINGNGQRTVHPSEVRDTNWEEFDEYFVSDKKSEYWESVPESYRNFDLRKNVTLQAKNFAESGNDYLAISLDRCRQKKMCPGVSVRMNDVHDAPFPDSYMHSHFYKDNLQFHLSTDLESPWGRLALNFEFKEVREDILKYIQELVDNYSFDWLELDFLRSPYYFPKGKGSQYCDIMTDFIVQIKSVIDKSDNKICLSARVNSSPEVAFDLGFDVKAWGDMKLIDALSFGNFFSTAWNLPVDEYRAILGDDIMLFPSNDAFGYKNRFERALLPVQEELINGFARQYQDNGADGVELFNFFVVREPRNDLQADFSALGKLSDSSSKRVKIVIATSVESLAEIDLAQKIPTVTTNKDFPLSFDFLFPEPESQTGKMYVHIFLVNPGQENDAKFRINARDIQTIPNEQQENGDILLEVDVDVLKKGMNKLEISSVKCDDIDCIYITNYFN